MPGVPGRPWKYAVPSACGNARHGSRSSVNWLPKNAAWPRDTVSRCVPATRTPSRVASRPSSSRSWSIDHLAPSPTRKSRERGGHRRVRPAATGRKSLLARTDTDELVQPEHAEVRVGDLLERRERDPRLPLLVLVDEPVEQRRQL